MGIDGIMETIIYLALFASSFALLGFVIGEMHGRPKLRRDKRTGRFTTKSGLPRKAVKELEDIATYQSALWNRLANKEIPLSMRQPFRVPFHTKDQPMPDTNYDPLFMEVDND